MEFEYRSYRERMIVKKLKIIEEKRTVERTRRKRKKKGHS